MKLWIKEIVYYLVSFFKKLKWHYSDKVIFEPGNRVSPFCEFEGHNRICRGVYISRSKLGYGSYIGVNSNIIACEIGRFSSIGPNVRITNGRHPLDTFVSTHPAFFSLRKQAGFTYVKEQLFEESVDHGYCTHIGNDVWLADNALIIDGVTIGDGAIVAASSVVTKNVPPYAVVAGCPAKIIRYRFPKEQIEKLCTLKWWDKDISWIKEHAKEFSNIDEFLNSNGVN